MRSSRSRTSIRTLRPSRTTGICFLNVICLIAASLRPKYTPASLAVNRRLCGADTGVCIFISATTCCRMASMADCNIISGVFCIIFVPHALIANSPGDCRSAAARPDHDVKCRLLEVLLYRHRTIHGGDSAGRLPLLHHFLHLCPLRGHLRPNGGDCGCHHLCQSGVLHLSRSFYTLRGTRWRFPGPCAFPCAGGLDDTATRCQGALRRIQLRDPPVSTGPERRDLGHTHVRRGLHPGCLRDGQQSPLGRRAPISFAPDGARYQGRRSSSFPVSPASLLSSKYSS